MLTEFCAALGLDASKAEPMQASVNDTYRFPAAGLVLRIGPAARADFLVGVARELERLDVPAVRLMPGFAQPMRRDGRAATVWRMLPAPPAERYPAADLAGPCSETSTR